MSNVRHEVTSNFGEAVVAAAQETGRLTGLVLQSFQQLFSNFQDSLSSVRFPFPSGARTRSLASLLLFPLLDKQTTRL